MKQPGQKPPRPSQRHDRDNDDALRLLHKRLDHLFFLSWKRDERINRRLEHNHELQHNLEEILMGVADDVKTILSEARDATREATTREESIKALVEGLRDAAARLEAQVAELIAGNADDISAEDLQAIKDTAGEIKTATSDLKGIQDDILDNTDEPPADPNA